MMVRDSFRITLGTSVGGLLLALGVAAGCGKEDGSPSADPPPQQQQGPQETPEPTGSTPDETVPVPNEEPEPTAGEPDAGEIPIQFQYVFEDSTTPTSEYVRGVDASAGEAERGFVEEDAGPDAN